ncbi:MAG: SDR family NAD(P)-dependent oxidoreductase, partial [Methyloligellaceae bacterium]
MQKSLFDVKDYVVCVTGASSGLGRATAKILADRGAHVVGIARSEEELGAWQDSCDTETASVAADLCKREDLPRIIEEVTGPFGAPDILINAAGVNMRRPADIVTQEEWDQTIELNLNAPFFLAQALVPAMKDKKWGRIINFASLQSRRAFPDGIAYG